jgi:uncharacterized protein (TIGR04255 family)
VTLNDTANYRWSDFAERAISLLDTLSEIHPQKSEMIVESVLLRYIDAEAFDYASDSVLRFLKEQLKVNFELPQSLFQGEPVEQQPRVVNFQVVYRSTLPKGVVQLKVATGEHNHQRALIWETAVLSGEDDVPDLRTDARAWLEAAHRLIHNWFFKLVEGQLLRKYAENE